MNIKNKLLIIIAMCLQIVVLQAQTVKNITVSQEKSYTDHLTMKSDSKDMDLMVKFVFNEDLNTLTISIISYRTLFVFWENTRYKDAIRCRWIHTDQLPYVVNSNPSDRFRLSVDFRNTLPSPRRQHFFKKWIEVEGLQPVDMEPKMVNVFIEQTFNIQGKRNSVTVSLRDIMFMEKVWIKGNFKYYEIVYGKDLNTKYQVTIQRNPCYGLDEEVSAAKKSLEAVKNSYSSFKEKYASGVVNEEAAMANFKELKKTLVNQFPKNSEDGEGSPCPDIQQARDEYNQFVDSIQNFKVTLEVIVPEEAAVDGSVEGRELNAKLILSNARMLDNTIARWLVSRDKTEREDLIEQCRDIINDTSLMIGNSNGQTPEERNAISLFRKAEKYYNKVCK